MSGYPSRIASPSGLGGGVGLGSGAGSAASASATTTLFRRLVWEGSVPLEIRIDQKELPAESDRGLGESYYLQVPRISYLPLIVPELKQYLVELVLSEREGANLKEDSWWFEDEFGGVVKWNWPIGLLYDIYVASKTVSLASSYPPSSGGASNAPVVFPQPTVPLRLTLHLAPMAGGSERQHQSGISGGGAANQEALKQSFMAQLKEADFLRWGSTKRVTGLRKADQDGIWDALRDHNFEDFWRVASRITPSPVPPTAPTSPSAFHGSSLSSRPPSTDPNTGTTAASSLPPQDRDTAYNVRSVPIRIYLPDQPNTTGSSTSPRAGNVGLPGAGAGGGTSLFGGASSGSAMSPLHPHLTWGGNHALATYASTLPGSAGTGTVIQPLVPPLANADSSTSVLQSPGSPQLVSSPLGTTGTAGLYPGGSSGGYSSSAGGQPATVKTLMETHLPLLFPPEDKAGGGGSLAHVLVHGVVVPLETELAWLGACMSGADGWVSIVVGLGRGA
ncbi:Autophagy protein 5 {ECO:0000256/RuleBase:RU361202} [Serendipita indica DSM 11827]|uniref:Autophagy protein 5 n=1 Tax=Serendipita indica (strain DSM 11827) TaxID=1109443 RepID=G4THW1_SERID|nr:Autophagy protein 5 {ECO:0000256/RuleBase:RU361202} [Serendipita indica DSM 11827]CCA70909.1 hypothetical protein PIIN_04845 [Serendipita indica DSM 11827]